jgi:predicted metal-dependent hydrolase
MYKMQQFDFNGITVEVDRKAIKHRHLAVYPPDGRVHISVPLDDSDAIIRSYLLRKWVWIEEKRAAVTAYARQEPREFVSGEAHYFLGNLYRLKIERSGTVPPGVSVAGDYIVVTTRSNASARHVAELLSIWYKERLAPVVDRFIAKWEPIFDVRLESREIRTMSSRWGTCSKTKSKAIFNAELAKKPLPCIEYVVAHELAHLLERTHNDHFQALLDRHLPSWRTIRAELNEFPV